jgi:iron complex outermembrane receptor protein
LTRWGEGDLEASVGVDLGSTEIREFASSSYDEVVETESADDLTLTLRLMGDHSLGEGGEIRTALTYADVRHDEVLNGAEENDYRQRLWSFGSEGEWRFGDLLGTQGSRLTLGFAVDGADTPETGGKPALGTLWDWGGRIGFSTLAGLPDLLVHGAVSRRTRFPALRELYSGALGRFEPNPDLRPEVLLGGELGFTLNVRGMGLQAVGFHQRLEDGIVRSSVSTPQGQKFKRINQDEVRSSGLEILASASLGEFMMSGDITLQRVRGIDPDGEEVKLEYEPAVAGKVSGFLPLPLQIQGGATARFVGEQYCENPEIGGLQAFDGSRHLDLSLRRFFSQGDGMLDRMEAAVSLDNATDAVVLDQCGLPQPGRTFRFQIRVW